MRRSWLLVCAGLLLGLAACSPKASKDASTNAESEAQPTAIEEKVAAPDNAAAPKNALSDLPQAPIDAEIAKELDNWIGGSRDEYHIPGLALGIVQDGAIAYSICVGTTQDDEGAEITPETLFNIQPLNPLGDGEEKWVVTAEGLEKAGVKDVAVLPKDDYPRPHGIMSNEENMAIPTKYVEKTNSLWTSLNGMMRFLAVTPSLDGLGTSNHFPDLESDFEISDGLKSHVKMQFGYTVGVYELPAKKLRVVFLANTSHSHASYFIGEVLSKLGGPGMASLLKDMEEYESVMNSGSMREMATTIESNAYDKLVGIYHNEKFGDIRIIKEDKNLVAEADSWRSRLGFHTSYDSSMNEEVDKKEAAKIKKKTPNYILFETDSGATVNETKDSKMVLFDPPVAYYPVEPQYDKDKVKAILVKDLKFDRVP